MRELANKAQIILAISPIWETEIRIVDNSTLTDNHSLILLEWKLAWKKCVSPDNLSVLDRLEQRLKEEGWILRAYFLHSVSFFWYSWLSPFQTPWFSWISYHGWMLIQITLVGFPQFLSGFCSHCSCFPLVENHRTKGSSEITHITILWPGMNKLKPRDFPKANGHL